MHPWAIASYHLRATAGLRRHLELFRRQVRREIIVAVAAIELDDLERPASDAVHLVSIVWVRMTVSVACEPLPTQARPWRRFTMSFQFGARRP